MNYLHPDHDDARLALLRRACKAAAHDATQGEVYLSPTTSSLLNELMLTFSQAQTTINNATGRYHKRHSVANKAVAQLRTKLRAAWQDVSHRMTWGDRGEQDASLLVHYQLMRAGQAPRPQTRNEWVAMGQTVLQGDLTAIAAGHPGLAERYALELAHHSASKALRKLRTAFANQKRARRQVQIVRRRVNTLSRRMVTELHDTLRELEPEARRSIMRSYGVRFEGDEPLLPRTHTEPQTPVLSA